MEKRIVTVMAAAATAALLAGAVWAQTVSVKVDAVRTRQIVFAAGNGAARTATFANDRLYQVWYPVSLCPSIGASSNRVTVSYRPAGGAEVRVLVSDYTVSGAEAPVPLSLIPPLKHGDALVIASGAATNVAASYNLVYGVGVDAGR